MRCSLIPTVLAATILGTPAAYAHAELQQALPAPGSSVATAPTQVSLSFTEKLEPKFSRVEVRDAKSERVDQGEVTVSGSSMSVALKPLAPGRYSVRWRVLSTDTHKSQGSFSFRVGP
jgi:methionine-rich copper-binding protein CopC